MTFLPVTAISVATIVVIILIIVFIAILIGMIVWGNKEKKKADEAQEQLENAAVPMSLLVIDKKHMRIRDAGLPKIVTDSIPKRMHRNKVPIVKAKAGPKIMTFMCDQKVYDLVPVKQEIKAMVSGIYIISVRGLRGALTPPPAKKKGFFSRFRRSNRA